MVEQSDPASIEEVFNRNLETLLADRNIDQGQLVELLEEAGYQADTPASILLNDAFAIAAVLGVSPLQLLVPAHEQEVAVTPAHSAGSRLLSLWLRAMRPLHDEATRDFYHLAASDDMNADLVAENWVWSERLRTSALTIGLNDAVDRRDLERVKELLELASRLLDQQALELADGRVPRFVRRGELQTAVTRATRFRRQAFPPRP
ncbi:MAG: hypothetical protein ACR2OI_06665 [Acidimicrobiia bacterium]